MNVKSFVTINKTYSLAIIISYYYRTILLCLSMDETQLLFSFQLLTSITRNTIL